MTLPIPDNSTPTKKAWQNGPELVLISSNTINAPQKSRPQIFEGTEGSFVNNGYQYFTNPTNFSFKGTRSEAAS